MAIQIMQARMVIGNASGAGKWMKIADRQTIRMMTYERADVNAERKDPYLYLPCDSRCGGFDIFRRGHGGTILNVQNIDTAAQICALMNKDYWESGKELTP